MKSMYNSGHGNILTIIGWLLIYLGKVPVLNIFATITLQGAIAFIASLMSIAATVMAMVNYYYQIKKNKNGNP